MMMVRKNKKKTEQKEEEESSVAAHQQLQEFFLATWILRPCDVTSPVPALPAGAARNTSGLPGGPSATSFPIAAATTTTSQFPLEWPRALQGGSTA